MASAFEHPAKSAEFVARHAAAVTIDQSKLVLLSKLMLQQMKTTEFSLSGWKQHELHPKVADEQAINWIFLVDTLNFSFWPDEGKYFSVSYKGKSYTGYFALCAAVNRALDENVPITDASFFDSITEEQLAYYLRADQDGLTIPMVKERLGVIKDCSRVLKEKFGGSFVNCIKDANKNAERLLRLLYDNFGCFRDDATYKGYKAVILKRAQILIADIWACFEGAGLGEFTNIDTLTMFADYRVPQVLVHFGVLCYSDELKRRLYNKELMQSGDEHEVEIRSLSIHAVELIRKQIKSMVDESVMDSTAISNLKTLNSIMIDFYLWNFRQQNRDVIEQTVPFHRVRSINY